LIWINARNGEGAQSLQGVCIGTIHGERCAQRVLEESRSVNCQLESSMRKLSEGIIQLAVAGLFASGLATAARAENAAVRVVFTKGGLIVGVGSGHGVLSLRGHNYPFKALGISVGATMGASTNRLVGHALNIRYPSDFAGTYRALGAGAALAGGVGGVQLQNESGVILQLQGVKVGVELSVALSGVQIVLE
jgi:hypothetical protein